jgi:hypothetical protein
MRSDWQDGKNLHGKAGEQWLNYFRFYASSSLVCLLLKRSYVATRLATNDAAADVFSGSSAKSIHRLTNRRVQGDTGFSKAPAGEM